MKRISYILLLVLAVLATACTSETQYGDCVGIGDDKDPRYLYKTDKGNVVLAVIFVETVIVPVWVLVTEVSCPVAPKPVAP